MFGYDSTYPASHLILFNVNSVQEYTENNGIARSGTWGTDLEMLCFYHMFNVNPYSPVNIEVGLPYIYASWASTSTLDTYNSVWVPQ